MLEHDFPILEYDHSLHAMITPSPAREGCGLPECAVACFYQHCVDSFVSATNSEVIYDVKSNMGKHPIYQVDAAGKSVALFVPGLGAPFAAAFLEEVIALGCRKLIVIGSCGVLDSNLPKGTLVVPTSAIRDEGTSYHYIPAGREVAPSSRVVAVIENMLKAKGRQCVLGKTWTTDAIYRETAAKVKRRRAEGCLTVEMEASALFAVASFRGVEIGQILSSHDDLSGEVWDPRSGHSPIICEYDLLKLAVEICAML